MKNEITFKAIILGILLSMLMSGAMAYLGLFAGMTISASIPAAIISMGVLALFKQCTRNFQTLPKQRLVFRPVND